LLCPFSRRERAGWSIPQRLDTSARVSPAASRARLISSTNGRYARYSPFVLCVEEPELHWFRSRPTGELATDTNGIYRACVFPGPWIDGPALLADTMPTLPLRGL